MFNSSLIGSDWTRYNVFSTTAPNTVVLINNQTNKIPQVVNTSADIVNITQKATAPVTVVQTVDLSLSGNADGIFVGLYTSTFTPSSTSYWHNGNGVGVFFDIFLNRIQAFLPGSTTQTFVYNPENPSPLTYSTWQLQWTFSATTTAVDVYRDGIFVKNFLFNVTYPSNFVRDGISAYSGSFTGVFAAKNYSREVDYGTTTITATRNVNKTATVSGNIVGAPLPDSYYSVEYKMDALADNWRVLGAVGSEAVSFNFTHTQAEGYHHTAAFTYRLLRVEADGLVDPLGSAVLAGNSIVAYDPQTETGVTLTDLRYEYKADNPALTYDKLGVNVSLPATPEVLTRNTWLVYRIADIRTGKILNNANGAWSSLPVSGGLDLDTSDGTVDPNLKTLDVQVTGITNPGNKGIILEFGFTVANTQPTTMNDTSISYPGIVYIYPYDVSADPTKPSIALDAGTVNSGNGDIDYTNPGTSTGNPAFTGDDGKGIVVGEDPDKICLKDKVTNATLICAQLPAGTTQDTPRTIRKINDRIIIIIGGKVIITYKIDPNTYPNLSVSQGWIGFVDKITGARIPSPANARAIYPPLTSDLYILNAVEQESPISGDHRLFLFGNSYRYQGYTVMLYDQPDDSIVVVSDSEPVDLDVVNADRSYVGGRTYIIPLTDALAIADAGYYNWLTPLA
jgi:hypothetical protein